MIRRISLVLALCAILALSPACSTQAITIGVQVAAIGYQTWVNSSSHISAADKAAIGQAIASFNATLSVVDTACSGKTKLALTNCLTSGLVPAFQQLVSSSAVRISNPETQSEINGALAAVQLAIDLIYTQAGQARPVPAVKMAQVHESWGWCTGEKRENCTMALTPGALAFTETVRLTETVAATSRISRESIALYDDAARTEIQ